MNPIDILGGILGAGGKKSGMGGIGVEILKDIVAGSLGGGGSAPSPSPSRNSGSSSGGFSFPGRSSGNTSSLDGNATAKELEDMLGVGGSRSSQPSPPPRNTQPPQSNPSSYGTSNQRSPAPTGDIFGQSPVQEPTHSVSDENAVFLVRAMIYAAKADGRIDNEEQQQILDQVGDASPQTVKFLRDEFAKANDVRDFAWSVPLGMEQSVYAISLAAINLDSPQEVQYLKDLAHGLRIPPNICNQLHQRYGIRQIF